MRKSAAKERGELWDPVALTAMVWAKQILAFRGLTEPAPLDMWRATVTAPRLLRVALHRHRLSGAAAQLVREGGAPGTTGDTRAWLTAESRADAFRMMSHSSVAARIAAALEAHGLRAIFFKGVFQAQQSYGSPSARGSGDIDVLVAASELDAAVAAIRSHGGQRLGPTLRPKMQSQVAAVHHAESLSLDGISVDLHRRLDPAPHLMRAEFDSIWAGRQHVEIAGCSFATMGAADSCVYVSSHAARDNWPQLRYVVDFVLALNAATAVHPLEGIARRAKEHGVGRRFRLGLAVSRLLVPELPAQDRRSSLMASWAWSRHRAGRVPGMAGDARDAISAFAFARASQGDAADLLYALRKMAWLPSTAADSPLPEKMWWAHPLLAPANAVRRLRERSSSA